MKELVESLRPSAPVKNFIENNEGWAQTRARQLGIVAKYVTTQTLLHLPYYDQGTIINNQPDILKELDVKIVNLGEDYSNTYGRLYTDTDLSLTSAEATLKGRHNLTVHDEASIIPIRFDKVPGYIADEVNNRLHYIRSTRNDSLVNYGLYIDSAETPYANVSFSRSSRGYQIDALNQVTRLDLAPEQVLSMTRAFTFNNAPKNSMSKLFHQSHERIKQEFPEIKAVITALNPYMGFDGGIFTGSSYAPYALSPMEYWYDEEGYYVPRSKGIHPQKSETPPIIWLAHSIDKETTSIVENIPADTIKTITSEEYRNG